MRLRSRKRTILLLASSFAAAAALVTLLFRLRGLTLQDIVRTLEATPAWLLAVLAALTIANQIVGVERWRAASRWLHPRVPQMDYLAMIETTTWGAFVGQFVPAQLSIAAARWTDARNSAAVASTLYEQVFGLIILTAAAVAALLTLMLRMGGAASFAIFGLAMLGGCLMIRWSLALGASAAGRYAGLHLPGSAAAALLAGPLARASQAPAATLAILCGWSLLRLALLSARTLVIAYAYVSGIDWTVLVIGSPFVGLAVSVPFLPAGLGVTEWTWTGLLVAAAAPARVAALTAIVFRVVNIAILAAVTLAIFVLGRLGRRPWVRPRLLNDLAA